MALFNLNIVSSGSISGINLGAQNQIYLSGVPIGDLLGQSNGSGVSDHGELIGLSDDDHIQYLLVDGSRGMNGDLIPDFSQLRNLGTPSLNWSGFFATSGVLDSGVFPLFSQNGTLGDKNRLWKGVYALSGIAANGFFPLFPLNGYLGKQDLPWKEVHAESGFFSKEFFFKGFSAHMANVYCGHNGSTTLQVTNNPQVVPIRTDVTIDFNYSRTSDAITLANSGLYKIIAQCTVEPFNTSAGSRGIPVLKLQVGGSDIAGAVCKGYTREGGGGRAANLNITWIDGYNSNDIIRMTIEDEQGNEPNEQIAPETARLIIERIR